MVSLMLSRGGPYPSPLFFSWTDEDESVERLAAWHFSSDWEAGERKAVVVDGTDRARALLIATDRNLMVVVVV
jgi:hypothetical protein